MHTTSRSIAVNGLSEPKNDAIVSKLNIVAIATLVFSAFFTATAFALTFWQQCIIRMVNNHSFYSAYIFLHTYIHTKIHTYHSLMYAYIHTNM